MQRNSSDIQVLKTFLLFAFLFFYQIFSTIYPALPPLLGLFFTYAVVLCYEKEKSYEDFNFKWYVAILYLFYAEQIHGFELFSVAIAFGIVYRFLLIPTLDLVKIRDVSLMIFTALGYTLTFLTSNFLSYLKGNEYLSFSYEYIMYIVFEMMVCVLAFKGRIV